MSGVGGVVDFSEEAAAATRTRHCMIFGKKIRSRSNHACYISYLAAAVLTSDILLARQAAASGPKKMRKSRQAEFGNTSGPRDQKRNRSLYTHVLQRAHAVSRSPLKFCPCARPSNTAPSRNKNSEYRSFPLVRRQQKFACSSFNRQFDGTQSGVRGGVLKGCAQGAARKSAAFSSTSPRIAP